MAWSLTNLMLQIVAGLIGAHAAAAVMPDAAFRFGGPVSHTLIGALAGALSGTFLQSLPASLVTASGDVTEITYPEQVFVQTFAGAIAGVVAIFVVGFVKHSIDEHRATQNQGEL